MEPGLQAGFGDPLGAPLLAELRERGVQMVRADLQYVVRPETATSLIAELLAAGVRPLLIVRPEQTSWLPAEPALDIELLNEPNLAGWTPERYAAAACVAYEELAVRHRLWIGSVSNCSKQALAWLTRVLARAPLGAGVTVHRYPRNGGRPGDGQEGFGSRLAELAAVQRVVGGRAWGCSEFGYHTGPQQTGWWFWRRRWQWTEAQVAAFAAMEWQFWQQAGAEFAVWYQLNDGTTADPIDRFGIRRRDGSWKPVADTFREAP
jgi:hypothetical protein